MSTPSKHPRFRFLEIDPLNGEAPADLLVKRAETPVDLFYVRNHAPVPELDAASFRLEVGGRVRRPLSLSLDDLRRDFPRVDVPATLHCAGNRRDELIRVRPVPGETPWSAGAIGHARWRGVPLAAVLEAAGVADGAAHVAFTGLDRVEKGSDHFPFGGSIPLARALPAPGRPPVVLAWEMNGEPLPPEHGFPLRVVVPGYIGARSVKWLGSIEVREEPSDNHYQARAYKLFPPHVGPDDADWSRGLMLGELSVTSVIGAPREGEEVPAGPVPVRGYAMAGGDRTIERVEVSADGGGSWVGAELGADDAPAPPGAWTLWQAELDLPPGDHELVCRAWDSAANTQPERPDPLWNFKGYMSNAWHRVRVRAR